MSYRMAQCSGLQSQQMKSYLTSLTPSTNVLKTVSETLISPPIFYY